MAVEKYNQATSQLNTVQQQIKQNEHLLKVAEYNLDVANTQLQSRAESIYKTRDVGIVDVLFASSSFDDLITQLNLMERLGNSDVDTVKSIAAYKQRHQGPARQARRRQEVRRQAGQGTRRAEERGPRRCRPSSSR